jgi:SDR family mycofactocin-dependent oxidoreductase
MGKLDGKVAVVSGAARGQGRSHAVTLAGEGADIIAVDICADIENNHYPLARPADLDETRRLIEKLDRRAVTAQADVREPAQLRAAVDAGVAELGRLDIVVANAGIAPLGPGLPGGAFLDAVNVNFGGVLNLISAAYPHLQAGASIIATGSVGAYFRGATDLNQQGNGGAGYALSKREVARLVHDLALALAPESIRVNAVHPANANTNMLHSAPMYQIFRPDLAGSGAEITREDFEPASAAMFPLPISWVEPRDISAAVLFLASDDARYVTGQQLRVDGGVGLKHTTALPNS